MPKQAKRYVRDSKGNKVLTQGDTARASLHNDTYYGAIEVDGDVKYVVRKSLDTLEEKDIKNIVDAEVRSKVENAILLHGSLKKALEETIWMNEDKQIPIKKVRIFTGSVTRPINIRQQRDQSKHEYKRQYHVQNDRNYMMAIYVGQDKKGKEKREFELVNNITAANFYRRSNDRVPTDNQLVPLYSKNGYELRYKLKIGTLVLLYENSPEEIWELDRMNLQKRLYKVTGMSSMVLQEKYHFGTIELVHHQDARPSTEIKKKNGEYVSNEEFRSGIKLLHTQIRALVQGVDFELNDLGEIRRLI
jgi:CRISPR-associated endonuclease Csn1